LENNKRKLRLKKSSIIGTIDEFKCFFRKQVMTELLFKLNVSALELQKTKKILLYKVTQVSVE
jgi:hypothetical protein